MQRQKQPKRKVAAPVIATAPQASLVFRDVDAMTRLGEAAGWSPEAAFTLAMMSYADGLRPPEFERMFRRGEKRVQ
jgi:hypothetical protein